MATKTDTRNYSKEFSDDQSCFGKLFDGKSDDCKKCSDNKLCQEWQTAGGDPSKATTTNNPGTKSATKPAPAKPAAATKPAPAASKPAAAAKPAATKPAANKPTPPSASKEKDAYGFAKGSKGSIIYGLLLEGKSTKADLEKATDSVGKSTVTLFLGDLQKAPGTYSASRGVTVITNEKTGVLSIEKPKAAKK